MQTYSVLSTGKPDTHFGHLCLYVLGHQRFDSALCRRRRVEVHKTITCTTECQSHVTFCHGQNHYLPLHLLVFLSRIALVDIIVPNLKKKTKRLQLVLYFGKTITYCEQRFTRSLSVVEGLRPRMYRFVLESCSLPPPPPPLDDWELECELDCDWELCVCEGMLFRLLETAPLWLPVWLLELLVLLGEAAVGTLWFPY